MKRTLLFVLVLLVIPAAFAAAQTANGYVIVNTDLLNVRSGPGTDFPVIAQVSQGYTAGAISKNPTGTWYKIILPGNSGWVSSAYLTVVDGHLVPVEGQPAAEGFINTGALNVRAVPSPYNNEPITRFYRGTTVDIIGRNADSSWVQIVAGNHGVTGWVNRSYITVTSGNINSLPVTSGSAAPTPPIGGPVQGTVNTGALNIRPVPRWWGNMPITFIYRSTSVDVIGRNADSSWYQVRLDNGTVGWARSKYLSITTGNVATVPVTSQ